MAQKTDLPQDRLAIQITDYLYKDTNTALMLAGSWGTGKTFYLKNTYFPYVKKTGFDPILISLFGVSSIEDIKDRILIELYPILDNRYLKTGGSVLKAFAKSADLSSMMGKGFFNTIYENTNDLASDIKKQIRDNLDLSKLFICFDDVERMSEEMLSGNKLLGYINTLTETHNVKVLLIANEDKIKDKNFQIIKEKTISSTIHFSQPTAKIFEAILAEYNNKPKHYLQHINTHYLTIEAFLSQKNTEQINFRTLRYFLSYYYDIAQFIFSGTGNVELENYRQEILDYLLRFSLCICIEYKKGLIDFKNKHGFDKGQAYLIRMLYTQKEGEAKKPGEKIIDDYFLNNDFDYYESIYNYLTGGDIFDKEKLLQELKAHYHIQGDNISESYKVYNKLSSVKYPELADSDIKLHIRKLKTYAFEGKFLYRDYLTVFYYILRDGNVLNLDQDKLCRDFIRSLKKHAPNHCYDSTLERYINPEESSPFFPYYQQLRSVILKINKERHKEDLKQRGLEIEKQLVKDFDELHQSILAEIRKPFTQFTLSMTRPIKLLRAFIKASNPQKAKIIDIYRMTYNGNLANFGQEDLIYSKELLKLLQGYLKKKPAKNASGLLLLELQEEIGRHIKQSLRFL